MILRFSFAKTDFNEGIRRYAFHDENGKGYLARVPEREAATGQWYKFDCSRYEAEARGMALVLIDPIVKPGTVEVEPNQVLKYEMRERARAKAPAAPEQDYSEKRNPNAKKYILRKDTDL